MADYFAINEGESAKYATQLAASTGEPFPIAALAAARLTLFDISTGTIINSRNDQDVLNTNDVTIDADGLLTWNVQPADNPVLDRSSKPVERHRAMFLLRWHQVGGGVGIGVHEFEVRVRRRGPIDA
jgi:hypothetical protein